MKIFVLTRSFTTWRAFKTVSVLLQYCMKTGFSACISSDMWLSSMLYKKDSQIHLKRFKMRTAWRSWGQDSFVSILASLTKRGRKLKEQHSTAKVAILGLFVDTAYLLHSLSSLAFTVVGRVPAFTLVTPVGLLCSLRFQWYIESCALMATTCGCHGPENGACLVVQGVTFQAFEYPARSNS